MYKKFTVESIESTPSGTYACYTNEHGNKTMTGCFGFEVGDEVEEWWNYDGYWPDKIKVNGVVTWTKKDKEKASEEYDNMQKRVMEYIKGGNVSDAKELISETNRRK